MTDASTAVVVAVDQGTSSTKAVAIDAAGEVVGWASVALEQEHPRPGWVEQNATAIADSVISAIESTSAGIEDRVVALAVSNQRESALAWDRRTGQPLTPVLGWQDRRTLDHAMRLEAAGHGARAKAITGLPLDPMFSALKFSWLLDEIDPDRERARAGEITLGTIDAWILRALTGTDRIELGNASRTQLLDLAALDWSDELLDLFDIPRAALPPLAASVEPSGPVTALPSLPENVRINAVLGDSHAALFGHGVRTPGTVKVTLGTGSSVMGLSTDAAGAPAGLVATLAWSTEKPAYAFEGNILSTGGTLVWLAELFDTTTAELFALAEETPVAGSVDIVPAFAGLGAPWWDDSARAILSGFDLGTSRGTIARAAAESIVLQIEDVLAAAERGLEHRIETILIDGGPASNDWLAQLLADLSQRVVTRPNASGLSALGAAYLGGISCGLWRPDQVLSFGDGSAVFEPAIGAAAAERRRERWHHAVTLSRSAASVTGS
ncbi:FGGY family carbohydrate kinase [Microbacterium sp. STN6]|uniref:FGGY family carbohydrate kinase n=1 Tax=Microbacterium sp. STN6 TaxID=2995588 RepID=UPI0022608AF5|nr:FGGY family carbohydrate kinase [Microbacterium sp. STN6]MCX7522706.1 FGGY family carbohydrate kinase [Microbacterium sp. STN6]